MVEGWLAIGLAPAVVVAAAAPWISRRRALVREWRRIGTALKATMHEEGGSLVMRAHLGAEEFDIRLHDRRVLDVRVRCHAAAMELAWTRRRVQSGGTRTGDDGFDRLVEVFGSRPLLLSLLDPQARRDIAKAVELGGELRQREVRLTWEARPNEMTDQLAAVIQAALRAASRSSSLEHADSGRLARAANFDPAGNLRRNALRELIGLHRPSAELEVVLQRALGDSYIEVVAVAAMALGEDGLELVRGLITDPELEDATRDELVDHVLMDARAAGCPPDRYLSLRRLADDCAASVHLKIRQAGAALSAELKPRRRRSQTDPLFPALKRVVG